MCQSIGGFVRGAEAFKKSFQHTVPLHGRRHKIIHINMKYILTNNAYRYD